MTDLIAGTRFEKTIHWMEGQLSDCDLRELVFKYCRHYQDVYRFGQLDEAFAYLEIALTDARNALNSELPAVRTEVEEAMCEYCISLNEIATAVYRLLDDTPMTTGDVLTAIAHVWSAYEANEALSEFVQREDNILCSLVTSLSGPL